MYAYVNLCMYIFYGLAGSVYDEMYARMDLEVCFKELSTTACPALAV
jgi:hypothetical protein